VVRRGREALLVPPREPKALAAAIARLLRDDALRTAMGAAGMERAQEFSWERVTAKVDDYYGVVIRRLAAQEQLPAGFTAPVPPSPRAAIGEATAQEAGEPVVTSVGGASRSASRSASAIRQSQAE
jgi:hypothetical protein